MAQAFPQITQTRGVVRNISPLIVQSADLKTLINVVTDPIGGKSVRPGAVAFLNDPDGDPVRNLHFAVGPTGRRFLYRVSGNDVYTYEYGTGATTWGSSRYTLVNTNRCSIATLNGKVFFANGSDFFYHDLSADTFTAVSTGTVPSNPKLLAVFVNRLIVVPENSSTVQYSVANAGEDWTVDAADISKANNFFCYPSLGGNITAISSYGNRLVIDKEDGFRFKWDGSTAISGIISSNFLVELNTSESASSQYAVGRSEKVQYYMNRTGIFVYTGEEPDLISNGINEYIEGIAPGVFSDLYTARYAYQQWFLVENITDYDGRLIDNAVIVYEARYKEFYIFSFAFRPISCIQAVSDNGDRQFVIGDSEGNTYLYGGGYTDAGTPIQVEMEFYPISGGQWWQDNEVNYLVPWIRNFQDTKILCSFDEGEYRDVARVEKRKQRVLLPPDAKSVNDISVKVVATIDKAKWQFLGMALNAEMGTYPKET